MNLSPGELADRAVSGATRLLERRMSRRGFFSRAAVVGSALTTSGLDYVLRPGTAYASVCGHSSSCASGWTAMCCTINQGLNRCPPGSFAGGWWKAADANLCGGKARYYVDCQAKCTECGCHGSHYCGQHCWNCTPHCAHHGTCDERRVCHNLFRYGQCDRHIHCSGPVLCRAISCTPPWKWANCSTTAASDRATVTHSAPCLPRWSAIAERYTHMGSQGSVLGATVFGERKGHRGRVQRYEHGRMYDSAATDPHFLTGRVSARYVTLGESASPLGLPTTDSHPTSGGKGHGAVFEHGGIYQRPGHDAHGLWAAIWNAWVSEHRYNGPLGYPTTDVIEAAHGHGRFAHFDGGAIYQPSGRVPIALTGAVGAKYKSLRYDSGPLGFPVSAEHPTTGVDGNMGSEARFTRGAIEVVAKVAHAVWGPIYVRWARDGRAAGPLGFPTSDLRQIGPTAQRCNFEHGYAVYNSTTGQVTVVMT
jgi:uncharacterized protein with LGFP repeats